MHPLHPSQFSSRCSNAINFDPFTSPFPHLVEMQVNFDPQLAPGHEVTSESHFFLVDNHLADQRSRMLLDSLSKEEAAQVEEGTFFLPFDWMYPEVDAHTFEEWNQTMATSGPIPPSSFTMYPNSIVQTYADTQTTPLMNQLPYPNPRDLWADYRYQSDEFSMYKFKVNPCRKNFIHDHLLCPYAHIGEKASRRDPMKYIYLGEMCEEFHNFGQCCFMEHCRKAHGTFEFWLHPTRYRTIMCDRGSTCWRSFCFFAHKPEEKRPEVYCGGDNSFGFGSFGDATLFGGLVFCTFLAQASHGSEPPFGYGEGRDHNGVKLEVLDEESLNMTESDFPEMTLDLIRDLGIL